VSRFLVLDSGPLGLLTHPQRNAEVVAITEWLSRCLLSGHRIIVPAIIFYELRRELLRQTRTSAFLGSTLSPLERQAAIFRLQMMRSDWRQNFGRPHGSKADRQPMPRISTSM
jgi:hypothetical protein